MQELSNSDGPKSILAYLLSLGIDTLNQLYQDVYACLAVFRSLPLFAKQYVLRLLLVEHPIPLSVMEDWIVKTQPFAMQLHQQAIDRLMEMRILQEDTDESKDSQEEREIQELFKVIHQKEAYQDSHNIRANMPVRMNSVFQNSIRRALSNQATEASLGELSPSKKPFSVEELDNYAKRQWESVLFFMVGSKYENTEPEQDVKVLLEKTGLMEQKDFKLRLTPNGFSFLFHDIHKQVWLLIFGYLKSLKERNLNDKEVLTFLFRLSFLELGQDYPTTLLTETQRVVLQDLAKLGMICQAKPTSRRFYPTRLSLYLFSSPSMSLSEQTTDYILVETTFHLYAFTTSPLQIALINMFTNINCRLPNMIVGKIEKRTAMAAFKNNIPASKIISFLEQYSHPQMRQGTSAVPLNVIEQLQLWEKERNRFQASPGVLVEQFRSVEEFEELLEFSKKMKILQYSNPEKRILVVAPDGAQKIQKYVRLKRSQEPDVEIE